MGPAHHGDRDRQRGGRGRGEAGAELGELAAPALEAALELLDAAAFLLDGEGKVLRANAAGRELLQRDPDAAVDGLALARDGVAGAPLLLRPVRAAGHGPHWLALRRDGETGPAERARAAARRWRLTRRQTEVVAEVARGRSNREVARALGCAESTVELHVTALLHKAGCQSRAELVARFWTER